MMAATGVVCGMMAAAAVCIVMPKKYESEGIIEVRQMPHEKKTPGFFEAELERILSPGCLEKVVERLDLQRALGMDKEAASRFLKGIVTTRRVRDTELISIRVRCAGIGFPWAIVSAVISAYRECRMESAGPVTADNFETKDIDVLLYFITKQGPKVDGLWDQLVAVRAVAGGDVSEADSSGDPKMIEAEREFEIEEDLLNRVGKKVEMARSGGTGSEGPVIIHQEPRVMTSPVSPDVPLIRALGAVSGFLLSPLLAFPVIGLLNLRRSAKAPQRTLKCGRSNGL